jgi:hypothetical protein
MPIFALSVFISAFLLFAVQPMVAKFLLPFFGGTAAVWSTCLVFFQILLLGGYTYAHLLRTRLSPAAQRWTHLALLVLSSAFLPPIPHVHLTGVSGGAAVWALLRALATSIGIPFFALSATAPLVMEWFRQAHPEKSTHRLYAFSNAGSLLALLAYPVLLEPIFRSSVQARLWSAGLVLFLLTSAVVAWRSRQSPNLAPATDTPEPVPQSTIKNQKSKIVALWLALPACGSGLLLALTNQLAQDVAPMPLLWVAPMAAYLLTFILCFEGTRSYKRGFFIPASFLAVLLLAWLLDIGYQQNFWLQVGSYVSILFVCCMVCHGELYRLRPAGEHLTAYYLAVSAGGALGGVFVALLAPLLFKSLIETPLLALAVASIAAFITWRERPAWRFPLSPQQVAIGGLVVLAMALGYVTYDLRKSSVLFARNFYGVYRVKEGPTFLLGNFSYPLEYGPARVLLSGQIYHGLQFLQTEASKTPTTYYSEEGGLGLAFRELPARTNRNIGAIGLGAGTLAAYGQPGDHIQFYELNPEVLRIAETEFTFLMNSAARVEVVLGDARLSLERQPNQNLDLLVLDAFSGDAVPVHLLTEQAMRTYMRHMKPGGVMAFHISNSFLDLEPIVRALAGKYNLTAVLVPAGYQNPMIGKLASVWMLLSANNSFLTCASVQQLLNSPEGASTRRPRLWTDDYSSVLPILR